MYRYNPYGYTHYGQYGFSPLKKFTSTLQNRVGQAKSKGSSRGFIGKTAANFNVGKQTWVDPFGKRGGKLGIGSRTFVDPLKKRGGTIGIGTKSLSIPKRKPTPPPISSAPVIIPSKGGSTKPPLVMPLMPMPQMPKMPSMPPLSVTQGRPLPMPSVSLPQAEVPDIAQSIAERAKEKYLNPMFPSMVVAEVVGEGELASLAQNGFPADKIQEINEIYLAATAQEQEIIAFNINAMLDGLKEATGVVGFANANRPSAIPAPSVPVAPVVETIPVVVTETPAPETKTEKKDNTKLLMMGAIAVLGGILVYNAMD